MFLSFCLQLSSDACCHFVYEKKRKQSDFFYSSHLHRPRKPRRAERPDSDPDHSHGLRTFVVSDCASTQPCPHALHDCPPSLRARLNMSSKGWFNLETAAGTIPETQFFEGDSAFSSLGLTRMQRLYGFAGWYVHSSSRSAFGGGQKLTTRVNERLWDAVLLLSAASYAIGLVLSVLGTVMLFIGSLASFAGALFSAVLSWFSSCPRLVLVLYALGTIVSLIGTGFLIGVCLFIALTNVWLSHTG
jgi:hypothetical protein